MSIIDYYNISDNYSIDKEFLNKRRKFYQRYLKQKKVINNAKYINGIKGFSVEEIEKEVADQIVITDLSGDLETIYSSIKTGEKTPEFSEALNDLIKLKTGLLSGQNFSYDLKNENPIFDLETLTVEKTTSTGKIANAIGNAGETLGQIQMLMVANTLIERLAESIPNSTMKLSDIFTVKIENTGKDRGKSTTGLGRASVPIQTDNRLTITNNLTGVNYTINFSNKATGDLAKNAYINYNAKLRQSTVGNFIAVEGHQNEILNSLSLHYDQEKGERVVLSESRKSAYLAMGAYLLASMVEEEKEVNGTNINDVVNFTIIGARLIPETNILSDLYDLYTKRQLEASVEGISPGNLIAQKFRNTDEAESYLLKCAIMLKYKI